MILIQIEKLESKLKKYTEEKLILWSFFKSEEWIA